jgi:hypothetical protein
MSWVDEGVGIMQEEMAVKPIASLPSLIRTLLPKNILISHPASSAIALAGQNITNSEDDPVGFSGSICIF